MDEFELIRRYFSRPAKDGAVRVGPGDDGAVLRPTAGKDLVAVVDTLVAGVHLPASLAAEDIGYRAVAVNLSDIAAMAARPRWITLALTLTEVDPDWLQAFADGLYAAADEYALELVGGDTTRGSQRVVTVQIVGDVDPSLVLTRSAAASGDCIFVTGTVGDAAAGLQQIEAHGPECPQQSSARYLAMRFRRPTARVALGSRIGSIASAAIDVSDGLYADLSKLLYASGCGGRLDLECLPLSDALRQIYDADAARQLALSGGDDYELCFTAPAHAEETLRRIGDETGVSIARIGEVVEGDHLSCTDAGDVIEYHDDGYAHFRDVNR